MDLGITNKVILITGGAKGIGGATSRMLADEGAIPVMLDKDVEAGHLIHNELHAKGQESFLLILEMTEAENCQLAVAKTIEKYGRLDALINNIGVNDNVGLEHGSPENYVASLKKNLFHYYNMAHYALPYLKTAQGSIVNLSSKVAVTGQGNTSGYASAKGAILSLTREWAAELLPYAIRVNALVPSEVMTPLYRQWLSTFDNPEAKLQRIKSKMPFGQRLTRPEEIAAMVVFLVSAQASHITGQHIFVDGGYTHLDRMLT
ncbi:MAG: SDR family oxidoreductase [Acidobacteria bacterium]|nr:SDR family oxidoreductase [Acidobacteriota bacterium]